MIVVAIKIGRMSGALVRLMSPNERNTAREPNERCSAVVLVVTWECMDILRQVAEWRMQRIEDVNAFSQPWRPLYCG